MTPADELDRATPTPLISEATGVALIIVNVPPGSTSVAALSAPWVDAMARAGLDLERIVVGGDEPGEWRSIPSRGHGLTNDAIDGLDLATEAAILVVVDATRPYGGDDVVRVVAALIDAPAIEVAVARSRHRGVRSLAAMATRPVVGSSDPFSGLIAIRRETFDRVRDHFRPVGRRFAFEILARARRNRLDVPIAMDGSTGTPRLGLDDLRQVKRLADDRLGNLSRLLQFIAVGASGMIVDLTAYAILLRLLRETTLAARSTPFGGPLDVSVAGAVAIAIALSWNFALNRSLTFSYAKKRALAGQFVSYLLSNAPGIALSYYLRIGLPQRHPFFERHRLAAALIGIVAATGITFSMARWVVFRTRPAAAAPVSGPEA